MAEIGSLLRGAESTSGFISESDRPTQDVPLYSDKRNDKGGREKEKDAKVALESMTLKNEFAIYIAAQTEDKTNGADTVFTARAEAEWTYDASGKMDPQFPFAWHSTAPAPTLPQNWAEVQSGLRPAVDPPVFNYYLRTTIQFQPR